MERQCLVLNIAYGTGPYLRTTELALAWNGELERRGTERMSIIVPWVYGEKQRRVMLEEFKDVDAQHPGEIVLDAELGVILKRIFYGEQGYRTALESWVEDEEAVSRAAGEHLSGRIKAETLQGEHVEIDGKNIAVELARSPRLRFSLSQAYFTSFAYIEEILEQALKAPQGRVAVPEELLRRGALVAHRVESAYRLHAIAYPATFSYAGNYRLRYPDEILVPPIGPVPKESSEELKKGVFVTVTGIPGLERLYADARRLGLVLYSNDTEAVPGSVKALPHVIPNKNVLFQFARSGWSSVWLSMISGTPLVVPDFDPADDPEIYFNNRAIEELGIGIVYRGEPLEEILREASRARETGLELARQVTGRWGTFDGTSYAAKLFVADFVRGRK